MLKNALFFNIQILRNIIKGIYSSGQNSLIKICVIFFLTTNF